MRTVKNCGGANGLNVAAWMLPLGEKSFEISGGPLMDRYHKSHQKLNGTKSLRKPRTKLWMPWSKNRYSFFFGGVCSVDPVGQISWNFPANFEDWKIGRWRLKSWGWDIRIFGIKLETFQVSKCRYPGKLQHSHSAVSLFPSIFIQLLLLLHAFHSIDVEFMLSLGIVQQAPGWIGTKEEVGMRWSISAALGTDWTFRFLEFSLGMLFVVPGFFGPCPCTKSIWTGKRVLKCWILDISILHSVGKAWGICIRWRVLKLWWMLSFAWSFAICGKPIPFPASHHHHAIY